MWLAGDCAQHVAGESYNQDALSVVAQRSGLHRPLVAWLIPEPENGHDPHAVMVWIQGAKAGYLPRDDARRWQGPLMELRQEAGANAACEAKLFLSEGAAEWVEGDSTVEVLLRLPPAPPLPSAAVRRKAKPRFRLHQVSIAVACPRCGKETYFLLAELNHPRTYVCGCPMPFSYSAAELKPAIDELRDTVAELRLAMKKMV